MRLKRIAHYDVTALLGEGGMGQVWQATDIQLNRQVALKILPDAFAADPERLARFTREAEILASLNHPNIAQIHGIEEAVPSIIAGTRSGQAVKALVLELVEGPTLADRVKQGPIPLDEALPIATQLAEALEAAHDAGVIHRDLKPANIKVRADGTVKVLDFGLAKALPVEPHSDPSESPTLTAPVTEMGAVVGTAAYMSPEQASGKPVDKRADIWAYGVVLYEMLTGSRAFPGDDVLPTLAGVIDREPDWALLPKTLPPALHIYLRRCLQKDPRDRVRDIGDVRLATIGAFDVPAPAPAVQGGADGPPVRRLVLGAVGASLVGALAAGGAVWYLLGQPDDVPDALNRFGVHLPPAVRVESARNTVPFAISPDGRRVVFVSESRGVSQIYERALEGLDPIPVPGASSDGTIGSLILSPDGEWVAYIDETDRIFKRVRLTGGPPVPISVTGTTSGGLRGASWGSGGTVVFATNLAPGLMQVPETGGEPEPLTAPPEGEVHWDPHFLPDGRALLFTVERPGSPGQVAVLDLESGETQLLLEGSGPQFAASGHLLFAREGAVWAVAFDKDRVEVVGNAIPVPEQVFVANSLPHLSMSDDGTLVYVTDQAQRVMSLAWVDREGREEPISGMRPDRYRQVRVSPDGTRLATGGTGDIWVYDVDRETFTLLTTDSAGARAPIWTVDGERVVFESGRDGQRQVLSVPADGSGQPEQLLAGDTGVTVLFPEGWTPDGSTLLLTELSYDSGDRGLDIVALDETGAASVLIGTDAGEGAATVSPDGRWLAYHSDVSGRWEVYVQRFPDLGDRRTISVNGGLSPRWSRDGRTLFFGSLDGLEIFAIAVDSDAAVPWGTAERVFLGSYLPSRNDARSFDVAPDGRLVMIKPSTETSDPAAAATPDFVVVQNWVEELKRLVPVE